MEQHEVDGRRILQNLQKNKLTINASKFLFTEQKITFLGHEIDNDGFNPSQKKIKIIKQFPKPAIAMELKKYLGILHFYPPFLKNAATQQQQLQKLITGNKKNDKTTINWTTETEEAFTSTKNSLCQQHFTIQNLKLI